MSRLIRNTCYMPLSLIVGVMAASVAWFGAGIGLASTVCFSGIASAVVLLTTERDACWCGLCDDQHAA